MKFAAFVSAALVGAALSLRAQAPIAAPASPPAPARLPELVVTATGMEQPAYDVPFVVDKLSGSDLQERLLSRTVPEALKELPSVMIQKTAHGQGSPFIRGFTGFRTLMLIDGIRLNNSTFRDGPNQYWNTIDSLSIATLELVKGPASLLYGSDAIGGTVNVLTNRRAMSDASGFGGRAYYRYASAEHSQVGRVEVSGNAGNQLGVFAGFTQKDFGDVRAGEGTGLQPKTGYSEWAGDAKMEYHLSPHARLVAAYQTLRQDDAWRTHRTVFGKTWRGSTIGNDNKLALDQARDLGYLQYHQTAIKSFVDAVHLSASFHRQEEFEDRIRNTNQRNQQGFEVGTLGLSAQLESPSPIGRWVYGVEHYNDDVSSYRRNYRADGSLQTVDIQGPVADDARYLLTGAHVQDNVSIGDRVTLIVGAHHTRAKVDANRVLDPVTNGLAAVHKSYRATVGNGRIVWKADPAGHWRVFGGVSQGFRAPNLSDLTRLDIARSGELEIPSSNLDPERFTSFEAGLKTQHARGGAHAVFFYTKIDSMIDRFPADIRTTANIEVMKANVGHGYVQGFEFSGHVALDAHWTLWGNLTAMRGEVDAYISSAPAVLARRPVSRIMPLTTNLGLRWSDAPRRLWAEIDLSLAGKQTRLSPGDEVDTQRVPPGGTPGYAVVHLRAGWHLTKALSLSASLENVTDKDHRIHGSGLNEPGRNLIIAADVRF